MKSILDLLNEAVETGRQVSITYNGGSQPGATRTIQPLTVHVNKLSARDETSRQAKTFMIDKIAAVSLDSITATNNQATPVLAPTLPTLSSLAEYAALLTPICQTGGWNTFSSEILFGVGGFYKNGKPKPRPSILIEFIDRSVVEEFNPFTGEISETKRELTGREKPWRVTSHTFPASRTYSDLSNAMTEFFTAVGSSSPLRR